MNLTSPVLPASQKISSIKATCKVHGIPNKRTCISSCNNDVSPIFNENAAQSFGAIFSKYFLHEPLFLKMKNEKTRHSITDKMFFQTLLCFATQNYYLPAC